VLAGDRTVVAGVDAGFEWVVRHRVLQSVEKDVAAGPSRLIALELIDPQSGQQFQEASRMTSHSPRQSPTTDSHAGRGYGQLLVMAGLSFASMYVLMYARVDSIRNVYPNFSVAVVRSLLAKG
jgi:hypothetical protein